MRVVKTGSDFKTGSTPDIASLIRATADPGYLLFVLEEGFGSFGRKAKPSHVEFITTSVSDKRYELSWETKNRYNLAKGSKVILVIIRRSVSSTSVLGSSSVVGRFAEPVGCAS